MKKYCLKWISNRKMRRKSTDVDIQKRIRSSPACPAHAVEVSAIPVWGALR